MPEFGVMEGGGSVTGTGDGERLSCIDGEGLSAKVA